MAPDNTDHDSTSNSNGDGILPSTREQPIPQRSTSSRPVLPEVLQQVSIVTSGDYGLLCSHVGFGKLCAIFEERTAKGIETYGHALESHNGRCAVTDALQEAADLVQYLVQAAMEAADSGRESQAAALKGRALRALETLAFLSDLVDRG